VRRWYYVRSSVTRFRFEFVAACCIFRPVAMEPVKLILPIFICEASRAPVSPAPDTGVYQLDGAQEHQERWLTKIYHAWREACFFDECCYVEHGKRSLLCKLEHDGVAAAQCGAKLPAGHLERVVPRDDLTTNYAHVSELRAEVQSTTHLPRAL
jgi:hypothetical protein